MSVRESTTITVAMASGSPAHPRLTAVGKGFDVVWSDARHGNPEIYLARLDPWGNQRLSQLRVTSNAAVSREPAIASPGDWSGIVWIDERDGNPEVYFSRRSDGSLFDVPAARLTSSNAAETQPAIAWAGAQWGVAYVTGRNGDQIAGRVVTDNGGAGAEVSLSDRRGQATNPALAWSGMRYGVVWEDRRDGNAEIYFRAFDGAFLPLTSDVRITDAAGASTAPAIAATDSGFLIAWTDDRTGTGAIRVVGVSADGLAMGPDTPLAVAPAPGEAPRVAWTGSEAVVAWMSAGPESRPHLARTGASGALIEAARPVSSQPSSGETDVAWNGQAPMVVWLSASGDALVTRPHCCGDRDADGADICDNDCDDRDASRHPGSVETCNGVDDDCDAVVDNGCSTFCWDLERGDANDHLTEPETDLIGDVSLAADRDRAALVWSRGTNIPFSESVLWFRHLDGSGTPDAPGRVLESIPGVDFDEATVVARPGGWLIARERVEHEGSRVAYVEVRPYNEDGLPTGPPHKYQPKKLYVRDPSLAYDGNGFALAYWATDNPGTSTQFVRLSPEGVLLDRPRELGLGDGAAVGWSGWVYGVFVTEYRPEDGWRVRYWSFERDGRAVFESVPSAGYPGQTVDTPAVAWGTDSWGLAYRAGGSIVVFARVGASGDVHTSYPIFDAGTGLIEGLAVSWNGGQWLVQWTEDPGGGSRVWAQRISSWGERMGDPFLVSPEDSAVGFFRSGLATVGEGFLSAWGSRSGQPALARSRLLACCPNGDADADGYCLADCDETNPDVHPGAPEICDGLDDDCDGNVVDEGPFPLVRGLRFTSRDDLAWDAVTSLSPAYDVQRGRLDLLRASGGDFSQSIEECLASNLSGTTASDPRLPDPASGWLYLVGAGSNTCNGSFDSGEPSQVTSRDPGILQSAAPCP